MELRYEGPHDGVTLETVDGGFVEAGPGDVVDVPDDQVHARLAQGWVQVDDTVQLPDEVIVGMGTDDGALQQPPTEVEVEAEEWAGVEDTVTTPPEGDALGAPTLDTDPALAGDAPTLDTDPALAGDADTSTEGE